MTALTDRDRIVLDIASTMPRNDDALRVAVRDRLDLTVTRYYQMLNALLDNPDAYSANPLLVRRLRSQRDRRRRTRRVSRTALAGSPGGNAPGGAA